jgi:3-oxo-5-alpha-steroid 4-dehydrogenase 1
VTVASLYEAGVRAMFALAVVTFVALTFITAPYGRHARAGWGPRVGNRAGWAVMESPSVVVFAAIFVLGPHSTELVPCVFFALWQLHYVRRAWFYPFSLPPGGRPMPVFIVASGVTFNLVNCVVNAGWIGTVGRYSSSWLGDPRFVAGVIVFGAGQAINVRADRVLRALRAPGERGYKIPKGGLYEWVSCPNYLGEMIEWTGWALATWSVAGLAFAVYTIANLAPRAVAHHRWYRMQFPEYPPGRKAIIPFVL